MVSFGRVGITAGLSEGSSEIGNFSEGGAGGGDGGDGTSASLDIGPGASGIGGRAFTALLISGLSLDGVSFSPGVHPFKKRREVKATEIHNIFLFILSALPISYPTPVEGIETSAITTSDSSTQDTSLV